ncbi:MAG: hypothetical protein ABR509_07910 [Candidatus Limnocylindria bacterium]
MANRVIADYIQRQRRTYTKDAIREALLRKGYRPDEVEEAFQAVESGAAPPEAHFGVRGWLLYAAYIAGLYAAVVALAVVFGHLPLEAAAGVLAIFLALALPGAALYAAMSRSLALGLAGGLAIAALIPFVIIVIVGGSCLALLSSFGAASPPPLRATLDVELGPPLSIVTNDTRGQCYTASGDQLSVITEVGFVPTGTVSVSLDLFGGETPGRGEFDVMVQITSTTGESGPVFAVGPQTTYGLDAEPPWHSGTVDFEKLYEVPQDGGDEPSRELSGTITWRCEET